MCEMETANDLLGEVWRNVEIEGNVVNKAYQISNYGRIKSLNGLLKGSELQGYKSLNIRVKDKSVNLYVHRLVAEYFIATLDVEKTYVIHLDYDKLNNHYQNLKWVSKDEMIEHNRRRPGILKRSLIPSKLFKFGKLSESQVRKIKTCLRDKDYKNFSSLAKLFGISHTQLNRIRKGTNWTEVQ